MAREQFPGVRRRYLCITSQPTDEAGESLLCFMDSQRIAHIGADTPPRLLLRGRAILDETRMGVVMMWYGKLLTTRDGGGINQVHVRFHSTHIKAGTHTRVHHTCMCEILPWLGRRGYICAVGAHAAHTHALDSALL